MAVFDVATAATRLGVDETEVCRRITSGLLTSLRVRGGKLCVFLDDSVSAMEVVAQSTQAAAPARTDAENIAELQREITRLEGVCTALREEALRSQGRTIAAH